MHENAEPIRGKIKNGNSNSFPVYYLLHREVNGSGPSLIAEYLNNLSTHFNKIWWKARSWVREQIRLVLVMDPDPCVDNC